MPCLSVSITVIQNNDYRQLREKHFIKQLSVHYPGKTGYEIESATWNQELMYSLWRLDSYLFTPPDLLSLLSYTTFDDLHLGNSIHSVLQCCPQADIVRIFSSLIFYLCQVYKTLVSKCNFASNKGDFMFWIIFCLIIKIPIEINDIVLLA